MSKEYLDHLQLGNVLRINSLQDKYGQNQNFHGQKLIVLVLHLKIQYKQYFQFQKLFIFPKQSSHQIVRSAQSVKMPIFIQGGQINYEIDQLKYNYFEMINFQENKDLHDRENIVFKKMLQSLPSNKAQQEKLSFFTKSVSQKKTTKLPIRQKHSISIQLPIQSLNSKALSIQPVMKNQKDNTLMSEDDEIRTTKKNIKSETNENINSCEFPSSNKSTFIDSNVILKDIIRKYKIKAIVFNFINKIRRSTISNHPIDDDQANIFQNTEESKYNGLELPQAMENIITFIEIIQILALSFITSLCFVYQDVRNSEYNSFIELFSLLFLTCSLILNLTTVKYFSGKKIRSLSEICNIYMESYLLIDGLTIFILMMHLLFDDNDIFVYFKPIFFLKIPQALQKIQTLEVFFIKNFYNEQYWSLAKIFLFNFFYAHIISILLTAMASINPNQNWMIVKDINDCPWIQQYIWSYYWANAIMLTIGFGDLVASNHQEALCVILIETFSCLVLAYNINCIGSLIQQIRSHDEEKSKRSKIFMKLSYKNSLSEQISEKISNFIEQNTQLKKKFNHDQESEFITSLPVQLKKQYLKQSNKKIFENLNFFKTLISKTLYSFAQKLEMHINHPKQVIQYINDDYNLLILKAGSIGFACKRPGFKCKDFIMDTKIIVENQEPFLINMEFITRKRSYYEIRSLEYSILYFLTYDKFIEILKSSKMEYEFYCTQRDKRKSIPDEFEVFKCQLCQNKKHIKINCPKLHFIPYSETVISKHLYREKIMENQRQPFKRKRKQINSKTFTVYQRLIASINKYNYSSNHKRRAKDLYTIQKATSEPQNQTLFLNEEFKQIGNQYKNSSVNEIIKEEINKLKNNIFEDEIWLIKVDKLADFNSYFPKSNPINLEQIHKFKSEHILRYHSELSIGHSKKNIAFSKSQSAKPDK